MRSVLVGLVRRLQTAIRQESVRGWRGHVVLLGVLLSSNVHSCACVATVGPPTCDIGDPEIKLSELHHVSPGWVPYTLAVFSMVNQVQLSLPRAFWLCHIVGGESHGCKHGCADEVGEFC